MALGPPAIDQCFIRPFIIQTEVFNIAHDYIKKLVAAEFFISITENGNPSKNAIAKRINDTPKTDFLLAD